MEKTNIYRIDGGNVMYYLGTAEDLSDMCKDWITEDIFRIPKENRRSFYNDDEFMNTLIVADELDDLWLNTCNDRALYILSYDTLSHEYKYEKIKCKMLEENL